MSYPRRAVRSGLVIAFAAVACDPPTAPIPRPAPPQRPSVPFDGNVGWGSDLFRTIIAGMRDAAAFPTATLEVQRDGRSEQFQAVVIERVYLPVPGSGGRPFSRRILMAWDSIPQRALALASDDSISTIVRSTLESTSLSSPRHLWERLGFATQLEASRSDSWAGIEGTLEFGPEAVVSQCALHNIEKRYGFPFFHDAQSPTSADDCERMQFSVRASAVLEHRDEDGEPTLFDRLSRRRITLYIGKQDIPGVRIVTQCLEPSVNPTAMSPCTSGNIFWREPSLYAARLSLDLSRMRGTQSTRLYFQEPEGSGPLINCCYNFRGKVRYSVFAPNGTILSHVDSVIAGTDPLLAVFWLGPSLREGAHTRVLVDARYFNGATERPDTVSQHALRVVDLALLPCPDGTKRSDGDSKEPFMLRGECYPVARFQKR